MPTTNKTPLKQSSSQAVPVFHLIKFIFRIALLAGSLLLCLCSRFKGDPVTDFVITYPILTTVLWLILMIEMVCHFFPFKLERRGSQKIFKRNFIPSDNSDISIEDNHSALKIAIVWIAFNVFWGILYLVGLLNTSFMLILSFFFAVSDEICVRWFCPFQKFFMKNRCCNTCRIYGWDYIMMYSPMAFISGFYAKSLLILALAVLFLWELHLRLYPECFSRNTNLYIHCSNCPDKPCQKKKYAQALKKEAEQTARHIPPKAK